MGQKIPPKFLRLGYIEDWDSKWYATKRNFPDLLQEDQKIRKFVKDKLKFAAVSRIGIERPGGKFLRVNIYTARPGIVIGRRGAEIENLTRNLEELTGRKTKVNVMEIRQPEIDAQLVAEGVALQLEKRIPHRRIIKQSIQRAMESGALGIKIMVSGRLGGNEIARFEWLKEGRIPLQTFRSLIDYGQARAYNTYGVTGVKVWIFKKELFRKSDRELVDEARLVGEEQIDRFTDQLTGTTTNQPGTENLDRDEDFYAPHT